MKKISTLLAASAIAVAFAGSAQAATTLEGASAPGSVGATGSIEKYIQFGTPDTLISLGKLGPTGAEAMYQGTWETGTGTDAAQAKFTQGATDGAEITWDANTHLQVVVTGNGKLTSGTGTANNNLGNVESDTLDTRFHVKAKGKEVKEGSTVIASSNTSYVGQNAAANYIAATGSKTLQFGHGPASGLKLDVEATRQGVDDHYGLYTTGITLNWSDLG